MKQCHRFICVLYWQLWTLPLNSDNLRDRSLIATLTPHIDAAIKASPCTCVTLRPSVILDMVLRHGLDSQKRITEFRRLCYDAQEKFDHAVSSSIQGSSTDSQIMYISDLPVHSSKMDECNNRLNDIYQEHRLDKAVRDCEEIAAAYNVSLRHAWSNTTMLSRYIINEGELKSMLATHRFHSSNHNFIATSVTQSPWLKFRDVSYHIKVTDQYRKRAFPLTYTSVFSVPDPEILPGPKSTMYLEDEIRIENDTPIEKDTLEITFYFKKPPSKSRTKDLIEMYSSLGPVHIKCHS